MCHVGDIPHGGVVSFALNIIFVHNHLDSLRSYSLLTQREMNFI